MTAMKSAQNPRHVLGALPVAVTRVGSIGLNRTSTVVVMFLALFGSVVVRGQLVPRTSVAQANIMASTILAAPLPEDQASILQMLNRADDLLIQLARTRSGLEASDVTVASFDKLSLAVTTALGALVNAGCTNQASTTQLAEAVVEAASHVSQLSIDTSEFDRLAGVGFDEQAPNCVRLQRNSTGIGQSLQSMRQRIEAAESSRVAELKQVEELTKQLTDKKTDLMTALKTATTREDVARDLWKIIGVVGLLSLAAMMGIWFFKEPIQFEWVRSGQVIQFVTVMVLLSVVLALGLTNVLKENVLGTLLGGIAGYVLSQGVGKAAAQEVARQRRDDTGSPVAQ